MVEDLSGVDEVELECKVDEYKKLCECQSDEKKKVLGLANAVHPKLDN